MGEHVLSIQSHVAWGYVGGRAAVFPLQLLGYDVEVVNTVNYSNHAGYGRTGGWKATPQELVSIFDVMEQNGLLNPSRVLTGYIPGAGTLVIIRDVVKRLYQRKPELIYLLDPVMGDAGKLYVSSDVIPIYREMLSLATIITPNYFEAELLTNIQINSIDSLRKVLHIFHVEYKVPHVVISTIPLKGAFLDSPPTWLQRIVSKTVTNNPELLLCITSSKDSSHPSNPSIVHAIPIPRIPGYFSGVGDLFSGLVMGHFRQSNLNSLVGQTNLSHAAYKACRTTHGILWRTHLHSMSMPLEDRTTSDEELDKKDPQRKVRRMKARELRLIQEQRLIVDEEIDIKYADGYSLDGIIEWRSFWNVD